MGGEGVLFFLHGWPKPLFNSWKPAQFQKKSLLGKLKSLTNYYLKCKLYVYYLKKGSLVLLISGVYKSAMSMPVS